MDLEFVKWLATLGVGGALAGMMFLVYRKDMRELTAQWRGQTEMLMEVVKDNTQAMTQNTAVVQSLHQHISSGGDRREHPRL